MEKTNKEELSSVDSKQPNHVVDLNAARRAALAEIDNASFSWFHVRTVLVAGVGFYTVRMIFDLPLDALHSPRPHILVLYYLGLIRSILFF